MKDVTKDINEEKERSISTWIIAIFAIAITTIVTWGVANATIAKDYTKVPFTIEVVCEKCQKHLGTRPQEITISQNDKQLIVGEKYFVYSLCDECKNLSSLNASGSTPQTNSQNSYQSDLGDSQVVATKFFEALKARNIQEATQYCEPQIMDDMGMITFKGLSYESEKICSMIASRMDDQWSSASNYNDEYRGTQYTSVVISDDKIKEGRNVVRENGEYYSQGKKVQSAYCLVFNMHKVNGEWKIFRLSDAMPIKTYSNR